MDNQEIILEQYKTFVETTSKVSSQRSVSNNFFIVVNTTLITVLSVIITKVVEVTQQSLLIKILCISGIILNAIWFLSIKSYKSLNSAKFEVINKIEESMLPIQPFLDEWKILDNKKWYDKYLRLTKIESFIPVVLILFFISITIFCPQKIDENQIKEKVNKNTITEIKSANN